MSFGGSNPPWQRNSLGNNNHPNAIANIQTQMMNTGLVGFQNLAMAQQNQPNNLQPLMQPIGTMNNTTQIFTPAIQYQNSRGRMDTLNPHAFQTVSNAPQMIQHHQMQSAQVATQSLPNQMNSAAAQMAQSQFKWNTGPMVQQGMGIYWFLILRHFIWKIKC